MMEFFLKEYLNEQSKVSFCTEQIAAYIVQKNDLIKKLEKNNVCEQQDIESLSYLNSELDSLVRQKENRESSLQTWSKQIIEQIHPLKNTSFKFKIKDSYPKNSKFNGVYAVVISNGKVEVTLEKK